ncbi:hypothetical protein PSACC_03205 [Paramicrosporidium saccamoebae]|uniref:Uncharacterized protein n=1 Tax=Paramicrosporidium saccamoebae TaxID=1246581 RepID=A0A2H9TGY6_9FUNG|nr:hypothetical protein PSACC_03205 [Paramicrosporidium saccamoebae]
MSTSQLPDRDGSENDTDITLNIINISPLIAESETSRDGSPLQSGLKQLHSDIDATQRALSSYLGARFEEARSLVQPLADGQTSLYGALGTGVLLMMRAMLTFAEEDVAEAEKYLSLAIKIAARMKRGMSASTIYSRLSRIFSRRRRSSPMRNSDSPSDHSISEDSTMSEDEIEQIMKHVELVSAEASLLHAMLLVATDLTGGWVLLMRESLNIRSSYVIYHKAFTKLATASAQDIPDVHYESGVLLGMGLLNMLFSLLPPRVFQVFSFLGYTGSISVGLSQLKAAASCREGLRAPMAELILLLYHTVLSDSVAIRRGVSDEADDDWTAVVTDILSSRISEHPNSPIYLYYQARFDVLTDKVGEAADILEKTLAMQSALEWPQLLHACAWELLTVSMFRLNWKRCHELATLLSEESRWSVCFSTFLEAIFLHAAYYTEDPQPETREEVFKLLQRVPQQMKRIAGRRLPIEKYAVQCAQKALDSGELPFYPEYELLLVWDGFSRMEEKHQSHVLNCLVEAERSGVRPDQRITILLVRASILRSQSKLDMAADLLGQVLQAADQLPKDAYAVPIAHIEWAQIGIMKKDLELARKHYDLSTMHPHSYILQRSAQLRQAKIKAGLSRMSSGH